MEGLGPGAKIVIPFMSISATRFIPLTSAGDFKPPSGRFGKSLPGGSAITKVLPPPISPMLRNLKYRNLLSVPHATPQKLQMRIGGPPCVGRAITGAKPESHQSPLGEIPKGDALGSRFIFRGTVPSGPTRYTDSGSPPGTKK